MTKSVFVSFDTEDEPEVLAMRLSSLFPDVEFDCFKASDREAISIQDEATIRQKIRERMAHTDLTVCFVSPVTHQSHWVKREIEESLEKGSELIAMALKGITRAALPEPMRTRRYPLYPWNPSGLLQLTSQRNTDTS
ncbi:MAG: TIR domain-containing protein [Proteobacteria bacterium]|nr:TIR domain-containing protein [Pseudomonadota bacterium]